MKIIILCLVLLLSTSACADVYSPVNEIYSGLATTTKTLTMSLQLIAIKMIGVFALIQFLITGVSAIFGGEADATLAKFVRLAAWTSLSFWILTSGWGAAFISNTIQYFLDNSMGWATGNPGVKFDVGDILQMGLAASADISTAIANAGAATVTGQQPLMTQIAHAVQLPGRMLIDALLLGLINIVLFATIAYVALKVFMVKVEGSIVVCMLPFSLSFLSLNALKDIGFAPFKAMLALVFRIIILGALIGILPKIGADMLAVSTTAPGTTGMYDSIFLVLFCYLLVAFLVHKSESIATALANGSANLSSGDAAAGIAAGAAAGVAAAALAAPGVAMAKAAGGAAAGGAKGAAAKIAELMGAGSIAPTDSNSAKASPAPVKPPATPSVTDSKGRPVRQAEAVSPSGGEPVTASNGNNNAAANVQSSSTTAADAGETAGIAAAPPTLESSVDKLTKAVEAMSAPKKPTITDRLGAVGQHMQQQSSATHINIDHKAD